MNLNRRPVARACKNRFNEHFVRCDVENIVRLRANGSEIYVPPFPWRQFNSHKMNNSHSFSLSLVLLLLMRPTCLCNVPLNYAVL